MAETSSSPLLNPVLSLRLEPRPERPRGGGKDTSKIVTKRLYIQTSTLVSACEQIIEQRQSLPDFAEKFHMVATMFEDSLAPTYLPKDLLNGNVGCRLVAPFRRGYLVEASVNRMSHLINKIRRPLNVASQVDISRLENLSTFDQTALLRGRSLRELWNTALEEDRGKLFTVWLIPFYTTQARLELLDVLGRMVSENLLIDSYPIFRMPRREGSDSSIDGPLSVTSRGQSSIVRALRAYRNTGVARATILLQQFDALKKLASAGVFYRIDPVSMLSFTKQDENPDNGLEVPDVSGEPIVAVVDGGLNSRKYKSAEAWAAPPFVPDSVADKKHGDQVSSIIVHGHQRNSSLSLPNLNCRIGTVQAIPRDSEHPQFTLEQLIEYLREVVRNNPHTHVWNISANMTEPDCDRDHVSYLGDAMSNLARSLQILPVISVGNVSERNFDQLCGPADCEAALVVGGRLVDETGNPSDACPDCLPGPGPDGMLKPDLSWFSTIQVIGNELAKGSSFATPLVSVLAAQTYTNLKEPTPDLVRALLINSAEQNTHMLGIGWGTPYQGTLPWHCAPGTVTLVWRANLNPGLPYYWSDIPVPIELTRAGKLWGKATLTGILNPLISPFCGPNYFASRLETSLQYRNRRGNWTSLLGSMNESSIREQEGRLTNAKWHPVRRMHRDFSKGSGLEYTGDKLRLYGRVYTRDLYQFDIQDQTQLDSQEVVFVLTLTAGDMSSSIYNTTVQELGNYVESAVIGQEIELEV